LDYSIIGKKVFLDEVTLIKEEIINKLGSEFNKAIEILLNTTGKVIVIGMGKSGLIGNKIAATLASTGTPSFSLHPGEALHGDLGMIEKEDAVIMLSYSGETEEMLRIIPAIKKFGCKIVSISGNGNSTMSLNSDVFLNVHISREVCPNNLAPTTSTTAQLIMGDALAVTLTDVKNFKPIDFARYHPGGSLGRKLLKTVKEEMLTKKLPFVDINSDIRELIFTMSDSYYGLAIIVNEKENILGLVTDGDLRRAWTDYSSLENKKISDIMSTNPETLNMNDKIEEAELILNSKKINNIVVTDNDNKAVGIFQIFHCN
jgi:arabinose-5-phosphate isomerase